MAALLALTSSTVKGMEINTFVSSIHKTKNHTILNMDLKKKKGWTYLWNEYPGVEIGHRWPWQLPRNFLYSLVILCPFHFVFHFFYNKQYHEYMNLTVQNNIRKHVHSKEIVCREILWSLILLRSKPCNKLCACFLKQCLVIQVNENKRCNKGQKWLKTLIKIRHARRDISTLAMDSVNFCTSSSTSVYFRMLLSNRGSFVQCCNGATSRSVSFNLWQRGSWQQACDSLCVKELWSKNSPII